MTYYYLRESGGNFTNLQLFALRQAMRLWRQLQREHARRGDSTEQLKERCVFIVAAIGLSVSQLLGQNNPEPSSRVPFPHELLRLFASKHGLDPQLVEDFERFNYFYNGCRHFGITIQGVAHRKIDDLTFNVTQQCVETALRVWRAVLAVHTTDQVNFPEGLDIDHPDDLRDIIYQDDDETPLLPSDERP